MLLRPSLNNPPTTKPLHNNHSNHKTLTEHPPTRYHSLRAQGTSTSAASSLLVLGLLVFPTRSQKQRPLRQRRVYPTTARHLRLMVARILAFLVEDHINPPDHALAHLRRVEMRSATTSTHTEMSDVEIEPPSVVIIESVLSRLVHEVEVQPVPSHHPMAAEAMPPATDPRLAVGMRMLNLSPLNRTSWVSLLADKVKICAV